jgi:hypothetical protein
MTLNQLKTKYGGGESMKEDRKKEFYNDGRSYEEDEEQPLRMKQGGRDSPVRIDLVSLMQSSLPDDKYIQGTANRNGGSSLGIQKQ